MMSLLRFDSFCAMIFLTLKSGAPYPSDRGENGGPAL